MTDMIRIRLVGAGFALMAALSNGTVGVLSRTSFDAGIGHSEVAFWRCLIALGLATLVVLVLGRGIGGIIRAFRGSWRIAVCSSLGIFVLYHFETQAFHYAPIPLVSILVFAGGLGAILLDVVVLKEHITKRKLFAMILVFVGGAFVIAGDGMRSGSIQGIMLSLIAGLGYASFIFAWKFFDLRSTLENFWWFLAYGCLMLAIPFGLSGTLLPDQSALPSLFALGLVPSFLGFLCTILAVERIEAYKTQVIESSEPFFSASFAILVFGEWLSPWGIGAGFMVIAGAIITSLPEKSPTSTVRPSDMPVAKEI